jgi:hypothetical protein
MTWQKTQKIVLIGGVFSAAVGLMATQDYALLGIAMTLSILSLIALDRAGRR